MVTEEDLQRVQLLRHALDVVKTVNADHELDALELLLEHSNTLLDLLLLQSFGELLGVDANRESTACDYLALELNSIRRRRKSTTLVSTLSAHHQRIDSQQTRATAQEMASVIISVESNQIAM